MTESPLHLAPNRCIDHALLRPNLTREELEAGIQIGLKLKVASICILPHYLQRCSELTQDTAVRSSTVIGFPHGSMTRETKLFEAQDAIRKGCEELDVVVNISRVLSGDWDYVRDDLSGILDIAHTEKRKVKVIFENAYLEDRHKEKLIEISSTLGADWIKTSTGFGPGGATLEDIRLMRRLAPEEVQVKASGGISDLSDLRKFVQAGATRVGTSSAQKILQEFAKA